MPSDIVPCLSWEQLQDTPTHYYVNYDILESDVNGRFPDDPAYEHTQRSCLYNLASHWHKNLDKVTEVRNKEHSYTKKTVVHFLPSDLQTNSYPRRDTVGGGGRGRGRGRGV